MQRSTGPAAVEMARAEDLPQLDASSLVDGERLETEVKAMYRHVAREERADLHFELGRELAEQLGYPPELLDAIPAEAVAVAQARRLGELLVGDVDADDAPRPAHLNGRAEDVRARAAAEVEHRLTRPQLGEVEVIADARERGHGFRRYRIE